MRRHAVLMLIGLLVAGVSCGCDPEGISPGESRLPEPPKISTKTLDTLLEAYRGFGLPLPPAGAKPAVWQRSGIIMINARRAAYRHLVWLIAPTSPGQRRRALFGTRTVYAPRRVKPISIGEALAGLSELRGLASDEHLVMSLQAHARGHTDLARALLARFLKQTGWGGKAREARWQRALHGQLIVTAWDHWGGELAQADTDRRQILKRLAAIKKVYPAFDRLDTNLLTDLSAALQPSRAKPGSTEALIDDLVDATNICESGCRSDQDHPTPRHHPAYHALWKQGFQAVPALIAHLEDYRLTRQWRGIPLVRVPMDGPPSHLRVAENVSALLCGLSGGELDTTWNPGGREGLDRREAEAWWRKARALGEEAYLLKNALQRSAKGHEYIDNDLIDIIAVRYPRHIPRLYVKAIEEYPTVWTSGVVGYLARSDLPRKQKVALLLRGMASDVLYTRRLALGELLKLKDPRAEPLLLEMLKGIPRTPDEPYWQSEAPDICALAGWCDNDAVWDAVEKTARRVDAQHCMEILDAMSRLSVEDRLLDRRIALLAKFLDDARERDSTTDERMFGGAYAGFIFGRLSVRNLAAESLAALMDMSDALGSLDPAWTEQQWAQLRRQVRQALRQRRREGQEHTRDKTVE